MELRGGQRIDHYTLLEPLGEGGQGSVWKVLDPRDGGVVRALKLVSLAETGPAGFERARREARILAATRHPALVMCHSLFEEPRDGIVGLVMDLVAGGSVADAVDAGRLDRGRSLGVLVQVAEALAYVHGAGLLHRDLKPENLLLTEGFWDEPHRPGTVKLVDFGIAAPAGEGTHLTAPGMVIGTLPYLAPELVDPASWGKDRGATRDVFAFGVLACRLLLGKHPTGLSFEASMIDYARAYKAAQAGRLPWPPPGLDGTWGVPVGACLALRPAERLGSGAALTEMLHSGGQAPASTAAHQAPVRTAAERTAPMATPPPGAVRTIAAGPIVLNARVLYATAEPGAVRTIAAGPIPEAVSRSAPRGGGWVGMVLVFLGGAAAVSAGALAYNSRSSPEDAPPPSPAPSQVQLVPMVSPREDPARGPCRKQGYAFDPNAGRSGCPVCQGEGRPLDRDQAWQMRLDRVTPPIAGVAYLCAQVTEMPKSICNPGTADTIRVTAAEIIAGKRVYISARDAGRTIVRDTLGRPIAGFGHLAGDIATIKETALCNGLVLHVGDTSATVTVYLDDP